MLTIHGLGKTDTVAFARHHIWRRHAWALFLLYYQIVFFNFIRIILSTIAVDFLC